MRVPVLRRARRLWPRRIRTRLALLYAVLFLVAGSGLLALTYALLASRLPAPSATSKAVALRQGKFVKLCKQPEGKHPPPKLVAQCKSAFAAGARAGSSDQRERTLSTLLEVALIGLGIAVVVSAGLGWLVSGRVLGPVRAITAAARRVSGLQLGERLALDGPEDELKELADTFDLMLERLDAAFASQKRFVANAAHELRTPLTAMQTAMEVTLSKPTRTAEQLEAMAIRVKRSVGRAAALIDALLTLATSELPARSEAVVDLASVARDVLDSVASEAAERGLTVETALESATTRGDDVLLERAVANLIENAVRHNTRGGWISVRTLRRAGSAVLEVANTGPRVSDEQMPKLFEPFGRASQRLNPQDGVGLGLSIARAIVLAHEGKITSHARAEGGLEFRVALALDGPTGPDNIHPPYKAASTRAAAALPERIAPSIYPGHSGESSELA